jgi:hypothetical protein
MVADITTSSVVGAFICSFILFWGFIGWLIYTMRRPLAEDETLLDPEAEAGPRIEIRSRIWGGNITQERQP